MISILSGLPTRRNSAVRWESAECRGLPKARTFRGDAAAARSEIRRNEGTRGALVIDHAERPSGKLNQLDTSVRPCTVAPCAV